MALKLTVYISDECGPIAGLESAPQDELNRMADRVLSIACKHADFYIYRNGDAVIPRED